MENKSSIGVLDVIFNLKSGEHEIVVEYRKARHHELSLSCCSWRIWVTIDGTKFEPLTEIITEPTISQAQRIADQYC